MIRKLTRSGLSRPEWLLFWSLLAGALLRLVSSGAIGVSYDEAYYAALSRHVGLSYFDHPPLLMWMLAGVSRMTGSDSPLLLRGTMSMLFVGSSLLMYRLTSILFDRAAGAYAALLLNLSLLFGVFIGGWPSPDAPLIFFLLAAMTCLVHIVFRNGNPMLLWPLAGMFMGFAMLSKYSAALTAVGALMFLLSTPAGRSRLLRPEPYLGLGVCIMVFSPVIVWNWRHDWISFAFQSGRVLGNGGTHPLNVLVALACQAGVVAPWIWGPLVCDLVAGIRKGPSSPRTWFLCCCAAPPVVLFTVCALWVHEAVSHAHWAAPGYLFLFPLLGIHVARNLRQGVRLTERWILVSVIAMPTFLTVASFQMNTGCFTRLLHVPALRDPMVPLMSWNSIRPFLRAHGVEEKQSLFVITPNRHDASRLEDVFRGKIPVVCLGKRPAHYPFMTDLSAFSGWNAVIVGKNLSEGGVRSFYGSDFKEITRLDDLIISRAGEKALTVQVFLARGYHPPEGGWKGWLKR